MPEADMSDVAFTALQTEEGVSRLFDNADYPSPAACKKAAIALRNRFYTMKAKERRYSRRKFNDETTQFDDLSCFVDETPTGWRLRICKSSTDLGNFFDTKTGEPVEIQVLRPGPPLAEAPTPSRPYEEILEETLAMVKQRPVTKTEREAYVGPPPVEETGPRPPSPDQLTLEEIKRQLVTVDTSDHNAVMEVIASITPRAKSFAGAAVSEHILPPFPPGFLVEWEEAHTVNTRELNTNA